MSGISCVGGSSSSQMQSLAATQLKKSNSIDGDTDGAAGSSSATAASTGNLGTLRQQIDAAITTALSAQSSPSSSSTGTSSSGTSSSGATPSSTDVLQTIHDAINSTLKANGIDPAQLKQAGGHHHHHGGGGGAQAAGGSSSGTDVSNTDSSSQNAINLLDQWLQNNNTGLSVNDPSTSASASNSAQNSALQNLTALIQNLPTGSAVNVVA